MLTSFHEIICLKRAKNQEQTRHSKRFSITIKAMESLTDVDKSNTLLP